MKWTFLMTLAFSMFLQPTVLAQKGDMYVAIKAGLSIRDKPDDKAPVIGKIPYGTRISIAAGATTQTRIITEGLYGYWVKVTFGRVTGYVVNSYLLSVPPPKATVQSIKEYLLQLSPVFGAQLVVKSGDMETIDGRGSSLKKQLYKNGASYHEYGAYEYSAASCFIPNLTTREAFLLIRLIPEYADAFTDKDPFPLANKRYKRNETEYNLTVEKEIGGDEPFIKKIHIEFSNGPFNVLEIFQLESEVVISYSSGV